MSGKCHLYLDLILFHWGKVNFLCIHCTSEVRISFLTSTSTPQNASTNCLLLPYRCFWGMTSYSWFKGKTWKIFAWERGEPHALSPTWLVMASYWFTGHVYHNLSFQWFCFYPKILLHDSLIFSNPSDFFFPLIRGYFSGFSPTLALFLVWMYSYICLSV